MSNDYSSLKVVYLKKELKTRGLSTAGNKDELIERLNTYTQNLLGTGSDIDGFSESITENDILEEDVLGEELDYEEDVLKKSSELFSGSDLQNDVSIESNNSSLNVTVIAANDEKPLPQREDQGQKGEKKVHLIRNRSISLLSDTDLKENSKTDENNTNDTNNDIQKDSEKPCSKIKLSSLEDRLEMRKRKFGVVNYEDKKKARAARFGITTSPTGEVKKTVSSKPLNESADILKRRAQRFGLTSAPTVDKNKTFEQLKTRAERFGSIVSPLLNQLSEEEKMQARKNRFLTTNELSTEEKKKLRAQRFNLSS